MKRKEAKDKITEFLKENSNLLIPTCNFYYKNPELEKETAKWLEVLKKHNKKSGQIEFIDENGFKEESFKPTSYCSRSKYVWYYASNLGRILAVELQNTESRPDLTRDTINSYNVILLPLEKGTTEDIIFKREYGNEVKLGQMSAYTLVSVAWLEKNGKNEQTHHIFNDIRDNRADNLINLPPEIHALCHKELSEEEYKKYL